MQVSTNAGHISFLFEEEDGLFELGVKVLQKQQIANMMSFIKIKYNGKDKLLYDYEDKKYLFKILKDISQEAVMNCLIDMLKLQIEIEKNGFIPKEAILFQGDCLFWNEETQKVDCIVLPVNGEHDLNGGRSWEQNYAEVIKTLANCLTEQLRDNILTMVITDKYLTNKNETIQILERMKNRQSVYQNTQITLVHNGKYGQFSFCVNKPEFVIGKKMESVDGMLNVSPAVSRIHCKIIQQGGQSYITDLGSVNHTYVNGLMVKPQEYRPIVSGDYIRIADVDLLVQ